MRERRGMRSQPAAPSDTRSETDGAQNGGVHLNYARPENIAPPLGRRDTLIGHRGSALEAKKSALVRKATALAGELFDEERRAAATRFIAEFYEHVPPADVADRAPRNLYGAALSLWRFGERRRPGQAKVRVHNPDLVADGWSSPHTIVEIVNDDMPFLVDSVTGAINAGNRVVHLIIHPILTVARGPDGRLLDILEPDVSGTRESWIQIEITSEANPAELAGLTQTLSSVLAEVRAAVTDWQSMRQM